ncbi:hypothetical protein [Streptomyces pseudogriseolus]|uniref:hypothetical protein n=1 Tax=Streptomyces pseudogriseolus TaxID=36817 RepID=UPI003FA23F8E
MQNIATAERTPTAAERILNALADGTRLAPALWDIASDIADRGVPANCTDITTNPVYWGVGLVQAAMGDAEVRQAVRRAPRRIQRAFHGVRKEMQALLVSAA